MLLQENRYTSHVFSDKIRLIDHFFWSSGTKEIRIESHAEFHYLIILGPGATVQLSLQTGGEHAQLHVAALIVPDSFQSCSLQLQSTLAHSYTKTEVHLLSFLKDDTQAHIDGKVTLSPGIIQASGRLLEENIILGDRVKVKTLPMLDVRSSDVQASHGARIEKLDKKKLFYLQSRGLSDRDAKQLMIGGYFDTIFWPFVTQALHDHIHPQLLALQQQYLQEVIK